MRTRRRVPGVPRAPLESPPTCIVSGCSRSPYNARLRLCYGHWIRLPFPQRAPILSGYSRDDPALVARGFALLEAWLEAHAEEIDFE